MTAPRYRSESHRHPERFCCHCGQRLEPSDARYCQDCRYYRQTGHLYDTAPVEYERRVGQFLNTAVDCAEKREPAQHGRRRCKAAHSALKSMPHPLGKNGALRYKE